jgi:hypothetical protein
MWYDRAESIPQLAPARMKPQDPDDETLNAIHKGAAPVYFKDRPKYYGFIATTIASWRESTPAMVKAAVRDAQRQINRPARSE